MLIAATVLDPKIPHLDAALSVLALLVHLAAIASLLSFERRHPTSTLAWLLALVFIPFGGVIFYVLFGRIRARVVAKQYAQVVAHVRRVMADLDVKRRLQQTATQPVEPRTQSMLKLGDRLTSTPASQGNDVGILIDGAATYQAFVDAIESATDHIHVEFYIVQPDETGCALRDRLVRRAREGIAVRMLVDGLGSASLPGDFFDPLREAGGEAAVFRPAARFLALLPWRDRIDFRNHRKLVIVDGQVGFTGGINVGREYLGLDPSVGYWRDTHIRIEGPAVLSLQKAFAEDWLHATDFLLEEKRYFPEPRLSNGAYALQVIDSGPDRTYSPLSYIYTQAIALARERVWITNPYFVPSPPIEQAIIAAALRGVDVRLLIPKKSDSLVVKFAAMSYFPALLEAGVRVYSYARGFVHAKTMVVDDWIGTIGSANMDMRSFHLNYELNAFVYGKRFCDDLGRVFLNDLNSAEELDLGFESKAGIGRRILHSAARMASPLL